MTYAEMAQKWFAMKTAEKVQEYLSLDFLGFCLGVMIADISSRGYGVDDLYGYDGRKSLYRLYDKFNLYLSLVCDFSDPAGLIGSSEAYWEIWSDSTNNCYALLYCFPLDHGCNPILHGVQVRLKSNVNCGSRATPEQEASAIRTAIALWQECQPSSSG
ncbi:MAG: hypothetical protein WCG99_03155 [Candidatus Berkelbacteria bacterium]